MTGPVRMTLTMRLTPNGASTVAQVWEGIARATSRQPGSLRQTLIVRPEVPEIVITSDWASVAEMREWERSAEQDALTAPLRALREAVSARVDPIARHVDAAS